MAWFAAHELFSELHRLRAETERLLAGEVGGLSLEALETLARLAAAMRRLEHHLRLLGESEAAGRRTPRQLEPVPTSSLLAALGLDARLGGALPVLAVVSRLATARQALQEVLHPYPPAAVVRVCSGFRHLVLLLPRVGESGSGEGLIHRRFARRHLLAAGARVRATARGWVVTWRHSVPAWSNRDAFGPSPLDGGRGGS
ncbi:hypothetical protein HRbin40_01049 [bacterium HR40]|nr:hypothetical protein HRbin40_01049 [bacterium HR40]